MNWTIEDQINDVSAKRPHLVILGAGASLASFPNGEKNGIKLPLMSDLVEKVQLRQLLEENSVKYNGENFESIFSDLFSKPEHMSLVEEIQERVRFYFRRMELPDQPTIYDHLVLGLREKDIIATFNWDPFLWLACARNHAVTELPRTIYLHGSVSVGFDEKTKTLGPAGGNSLKTGNYFKPSNLLFPIKQKDYNSDAFIKGGWEIVKSAMKAAWMVTIFGYSAPETDIEAKKLLKEGWGRWEEREYEQIEFIDIKSDDELATTWEEFIHTHHYHCETDFYGSYIAKFPRRSCEALWSQMIDAKWIHPNQLPKHNTMQELYDWLRPLMDAEKAVAK